MVGAAGGKGRSALKLSSAILDILFAVDTKIELEIATRHSVYVNYGFRGEDYTYLKRLFNLGSG